MLSNVEIANIVFQEGISLSAVRRTKDALFLFSDTIKDPYWNHVAKINLAKGETRFLNDVATFYLKRGRLPAVYITPWTRPRDFEKTLSTAGYVLEYRESWMVRHGRYFPKQIDVPGLEISEVKTSPDMESFSKVLSKSYRSPDVSDRYSKLPASYGKTLLSSHAKTWKTKAVKRYLAWLDSMVVGCASLILGGEYAGLYDLGVIPEYRNRRIGPALSIMRIAEASRANVSTIFFQADVGSKVERYYEKYFGFKREFEGKEYVKF